MALTIDKSKAAILAMDLENAVVHESRSSPFAEMAKKHGTLDKIARLLDAGRKAGVPIIYIVVTFPEGSPEIIPNSQLFQGVQRGGGLREGTWEAQVHEKVAPKPGDWVIRKTRVSAFYGTPLEAVLRHRGISTLVLSGVSTNFVVESTARYAHDAGFNVIIAKDCCAGNEQAHTFTLEQVLPMLTTVVSLDEVLAALK